jgi:hypothetical protein
LADGFGKALLTEKIQDAWIDFLNDGWGGKQLKDAADWLEDKSNKYLGEKFTDLFFMREDKNEESMSFK